MIYSTFHQLIQMWLYTGFWLLVQLCIFIKLLKSQNVPVETNHINVIYSIARKVVLPVFQVEPRSSPVQLFNVLV